MLLLPAVVEGLAVEGGIPVWQPVPSTDRQEVVGAVGVSGAQSDQDASLAAGAIASFLQRCPGSRFSR